MALTSSIIEQLVEWCAKSEAIADIRAGARGNFFGYEDSEPVNYLADTGDIDSRERRFLGWFVFNFKLADGRHPGELAADAILKKPVLSSALKSIRNARYVVAVVTSVISGQGFYLELEDEEFEVNSHMLSHILQKGSTLCIHIVPTVRNQWLPAPGWSAWPIRLGPGMRSRLKSTQPSPIEIERFLQGRVKVPKELQNIEHPTDDTLEAAVARMSEAAKKAGRMKLIMRPEEWKNIVLSYMTASDFDGFVEEIVKRGGKFKSVEDANKWLALVTNIWNTTPQPDRGGKSANELFRQKRDII